MVNNKFKLTDNFLNKMKKRVPPFGFAGLGEFTFYRTYSRIKLIEDGYPKEEVGQKEAWWEVVKRNVEGCYNIQLEHTQQNGTEWNAWSAQLSAQEMYTRIFEMKFLPSGRGLWAMGAAIITLKGMTEALHSCAYYSTQDMKDEPTKPFEFLMDLSMLGVGVSFDFKGAGTIKVKSPDKRRKTEIFEVPDTREGWVESVKILAESYFLGTHPIEFDYSLIRAKGMPIKTFGGIASGYEPLKELHIGIKETLDKNIGQPITERSIADIMNRIGACVVAGNIRRCLPGDTLVHSTEGLVPIKDIKVGDKVYTSKGISKVTDFISQGRQELVKVKSQYGEFRATRNHKVAIFNKEDPKEYTWKVVGDLTTDDFLVIPLLPGTVVEIAGGVFETVKDGATIELAAAAVTSVSQESTIEETYDISVDAQEFIINDGILVHNSASLALGELDSEEFMNLKNYDINPDRAKFGWASNNSVDAKLGMDYSSIVERIKTNGEPGILLMENARNYGRMGDPPDYKDRLVSAANPSLRGSTLVFTDKGYFPIKQLAEEYPISTLFTGNNEWKSGKVFKSGENQQLVRITFTNGQEVYCTKEHKWPIIDIENGEIYFEKSKFRGTKKTALKVKTGDKIYNPSRAHRNVSRHKFPEELVTKSTIISNGNFNIIKSVELTDIYEDVYDITVDDDTHTFMTEVGITGNCGEQFLEPGETCNLVETFPDHHENIADYKRTLKYAYLYAKSISLLTTHWAETNRINLRNRRIGISPSGVAQFISHRGIHELKQWFNEGYNHIKELDVEYSKWLAVRESIRMTTCKPSGSVSLLAGATPGVHYPESRFYIRRVRVNDSADLAKAAKEAGYPVEDLVIDQSTGETDPNTAVVSFPIDAGEGIRTMEDVTLWEQAETAAFVQKYWSDNGVSVTLKFDPDTEVDSLLPLITFYQYKLKGMSFMPKLTFDLDENGEKIMPYPQMPYEPISEEEYKLLISKITGTIDYKKVKPIEAVGEKFCTGDSCEITAIMEETKATEEKS